jgi:hypothetical protein
MKKTPLFAFSVLVLTVSAAHAANFTWASSTTGGNWSTPANWSSTTTGTFPSWGGNIAYLNNVTSGTRTVVADNATNGCNGLVITQTTAGAVNLLDIQAGGFNISSPTTIGATAGTAEVLIDATSRSVTANLSSDGSTTTIGSGGVLALQSSGTYTASYTGNLLVSGGLVTASGSNLAISGSTMEVSSGTVALASVTGTALGGKTLTVDGGLVNLSGSGITVSNAATVSSGTLALTSGSGFNFSGGVTVKGGLFQISGTAVSLYGTGLSMSSGTISLGNASAPTLYGSGLNITGGTVVSAVTSSFNVYGATSVYNPTSTVGTIGLTFWGQSTTPTMTMEIDAYNNGATLRSNVATVQKFVLSSTSASSIGSVTLMNQYASGSTTLALGSNVSVSSFNVANYSGTDNATFTVDPAGYTLSIAGVWTPANAQNSGVKNTYWVVGNSTGTGAIAAANFNLFSAYSTSVTGNVVLSATGGTGSANVLSGSNGTIAPTSTFLYTGAGTTGSPATITSNRTIGRLEVGNGTSASYLKLTGAALSVGADVTVKAGSVFDLGGLNLTESVVAGGTSGGLNGAGTIRNNTASTTSTLTLDTSNGNGSFSGAIVNNSGAGGTVAVTKTGSGTQTLSGVNTYTGATTVSGGTLKIDGSLGNSVVSVGSGAVLSGSGTVGGTVNATDATINGSGLTLGATTLNGASNLSGYNIASSVTVSTGSTSLTGTTTASNNGTLSVTAGATLNNSGVINGKLSVGGVLEGSGVVNGDLSLDSSAQLTLDVSGTVAGISFDQIKVNGNVTLAGTLDLSKLSGLTLGSTIALIDNTGTNTTTGGFFTTIVTSGSTYTISASTGSYTFNVGGTDYSLNYASNADGGALNNDVTLSVVPEPSVWAMLLGGIGSLISIQRLRRRG